MSVNSIVLAANINLRFEIKWHILVQKIIIIMITKNKLCRAFQDVQGRLNISSFTFQWNDTILIGA